MTSSKCWTPCFLALRPYTGHSDQTPAMNRPIYSIYFEHIIPSRRSKYRFSDVEHEILPCELSYGLLKLQSNRTFIYYMKERLFNIATLLRTKGFSQHDDCMIPSCLVRNSYMLSTKTLESLVEYSETKLYATIFDGQEKLLLWHQHSFPLS